MLNDFDQRREMAIARSGEDGTPYESLKASSLARVVPIPLHPGLRVVHIIEVQRAPTAALNISPL
jgi:hypothetical protein